MGSLFTAAQELYLKAHKLAVLATGRQDGSPQISMVAYHWDGTDIVITLEKHNAKWQNAVRQPNLALLVHDGGKQVIVYGTAECIDQDPLRGELAARLYSAFFDDPDKIAKYEHQHRPILRITPNKAFDHNL